LVYCEGTAMTLPPLRRCLALLILPGILTAALLMAGRAAANGPQASIDFNRQILPILSENCFACHGLDEKQRKAKLRLDTREGALAARKHGAAVVPGKAAASALVARISAEEDSMLMPPPKSGKHLKPEQIALLTRWIDQGAPWGTHWAWTAPRRPELPKVHNASWPRSPIDYFILARLEKEGLQPQAEADRPHLLRRVTLDLTGLPPTPAEVEAFLADKRADAYERVVERLLESSRYGEHMARYWLDAARYGDTHGLHLDNYREIWPYREWVIGAFNRNLPFDRFLIEQLAGDLLPNPTNDQLIATGFNRCHVTTNEGGSIDEECYVRNTVDRVDTNGTVLMGLSIGCARCHDHKYDPFKQKDYYSLFAFFNSLGEAPLDGNAARYPPILRVATGEQAEAAERNKAKIETLHRRIAAEVAQVPRDEAAPANPAPPAAPAEYVWIDDAVPAGVKFNVGGVNAAWDFVAGPGNPVLSGTRSLRRSGGELTQNYFEAAQPGLRVGEGDKLFAHVWLDPKNPPKQIMLQWHTDGWKHRAYWGENLIPWGADNSPERLKMGPLPPAAQWVRLEVDAIRVGLAPSNVITGWAFTQHGGTVWWDKAGIVTRTPQAGQSYDSLAAWLQTQQSLGGAGLPAAIAAAIKTDRARWTAEQKKQVGDYFVEHAWSKTRAGFEPLHRELADLEKEQNRLEQQLPTTLVAHEMETPRTAFILKRGEYDQRGAKVERATPASLPPMDPQLPRNRLGFARWLVAPTHPLTARVAVNRFWQQCFGTGIVKTSEDFGTQGEAPSHPELLDWLAVQFQEDGWDVKKLMKCIVTSATYRQSAKATPDRLAKDPANRLLSRGPRFRLDAEMVRDQALFVSGLLVERIGGPSVKPPQPAGLWEAVGYSGSNTVHFTADVGHEKVHRRSLYTFWKRTAPPPQMTAFDAPSRESCTVRRERTDTPLQALLLLNEEQFFEAARCLAQRALHEAGLTTDERMTRLFQLAVGRRPDASELAELKRALGEQQLWFDRNGLDARKLIQVGTTRPDPTINPADLAAWTVIANLVLNLDEVINKG
jgi:hypothetical protein